MLSLTLIFGTFAAPLAHAEATVSGVSVQEGTGYTNVVVKATASEDATLVYKVMSLAGDTLKTVEQAASAGENSCVIDLTDLEGGADKNSTYKYEVSVGSSSASAYYSNVGWQTNVFFSADATTEPATYFQGAWKDPAPSVSNKAFQVVNSNFTFNVTGGTSGGADTDHEIVDFQSKIAIESYYLLDEITYDVTNAIGAISLVTNDDEQVEATWMVLKEGTNWVNATGASSTATNTYTLRMEVDYSTSHIRYSVKADGESEWSVLTAGGDQWVAGPSSPAFVSSVGFSCKMAIANFGARLSTKAVVDVAGTEYKDLDSALAAAKTGNKDIFLFTNLKILPIGLTEGTYTIVENGKSVKTVDIQVVAPATEGGYATYNDSSLMITTVLYVAELSDGVFAQAGNLRYRTMPEAAAVVTNGATIFLVTNVADNATFSNANVAFTMDLRGNVLACKSADAPILAVSGDTVKLYLTSTAAGSITGATDQPAICATNGATIVIDGIWVTNSTTAISACSASGVVISNGLFSGAFATSGETAGQITLLGGCLVDGASFTGANVDATGGKFTTSALTAKPDPATGYVYTDFANPMTTNGYTFVKEIMLDISGSVGSAHVWNVYDDNNVISIGGVQLPDKFVEDVAELTHPSGGVAATQEVLNAVAPYTTGKAKYWECYVLGVTNLESTTDGPYVKGAQDASANKVGFLLDSPAGIKAAESGCKVEYLVESYGSTNFTGTVKESSERIGSDKSARLDIPDGVRYYKLKVYIEPKK